jgi:hypothetical protein
MCRSPFGGVDSEQKLHKILCWRRGRLNDKYGTTADTLIKGGLELAITELTDCQIAKLHSVALGNPCCHGLRASASKDFEFMNCHYVLEFGFIVTTKIKPKSGISNFSIANYQHLPNIL